MGNKLTVIFSVMIFAGLVFGEQELPVMEHVKNISFVLPGGEKILRHQAIIPAKREDVWKVMTTTEGLTSFAFPVGSIELKIGGVWEATYNPDGKLGDPNNIYNEIISYVPEEMLSIRIKHCPPGFPAPKVAEHIWTVTNFESTDSTHTKVTTSMMGWQNTPDDEKVYKLFEAGNAWEMQELYNRFVNGPTKWKKEK